MPLSGTELSDAMTAPTDNLEALSAQVLMQIRDSLTALNRKQDTFSGKIDDALMRVVRLEARDERLERVERAVEKIDTKVDILMADKDKREGGSASWRAFLSWWGPIAWTIGIMFTVFYLLFRATGIIHLPTDPPIPQGAQVERPIIREGAK